MSKLDKVIKGLELVKQDICERFVSGSQIAVDRLRIDNAIELLKEQEDLGTELTNAVELIHKKNERIEKLLKEKEDRHRLEVHNIGNVDIPEGVSKEHFHLVMNNVVEALQHTDKGESYPYEDTGR